MCSSSRLRCILPGFSPLLSCIRLVFRGRDAMIDFKFNFLRNALFFSSDYEAEQEMEIEALEAILMEDFQGM